MAKQKLLQKKQHVLPEKVANQMNKKRKRNENSYNTTK